MVLRFQGGENDAFLATPAGTTDAGAYVAPNRAGSAGVTTPFFADTPIGSCRFMAGNDGQTYSLGYYSGSTIFELKSADNVARIRLQTAGSNNLNFQWYNGTAWVTIGGAFYGAWSDDVAVNINWKIDAAAGYITLFVNGSFVRGITAADTSALSPIARVQSYTPSQERLTISELIVDTQNCLNSRVYHFPPTAQGDDAGGTGNYTAIDETAVSVADFVQFDAVGQKQCYTSAARATTLRPTGLTVVGNFLRTSETGPTGVRAYLKIGGVYYYGAAQAVDVINTHLRETWLINPATGLAWTNAEINAATLQWGWEAVAA
ncbi:hypothetical protein [Croceicoccus sp. BE223]|uniref:hypothetical protein n=1 Tax=Croceicoccus sp. BE223 TaxID=2817716 RepID=UPI0028586516|nr:hypothetical protein [Croceicoccus sp. BE223]MDR7101462.1 hypothetical protein [Croceicoccus sp. BE223]